MAFTASRRTFLAGIALAGASLALAGCGKEDPKTDDKTITVAASPTPHAQILNGPVREILEAQGYTLVVQEFTDYVLPNTATEDGEVDANFFQHTPYLDSFNADHGTHLVSVGMAHFEPFGIYPGRTAKLEDLKKGAIVAVPNDPSNEARALLLLEQEGLITLKEGAGVTAAKNDIVDNPLELEIKELEAATIPSILPDVDIACINGNYALQADLTSADALALEAADSLAAETYGNILVVKEGNEDLEKIQALAKALLSPEAKAYMDETFPGAVVPVF